MLTYTAAINSLYALGHELGSATPRKFDLQNMCVLAASLGNPERKFKSVLIAGTNGKGSTSATLASILRAAGYRTALYTSPHLTRVNERIQLDGNSISDTDFAAIYSQVDSVAEQLIKKGTLPEYPSFFEMMTAIAFEYFAKARVDIAVLEVGMGGRLDATNIVEPCFSIITDIALDHQQYLGNTIAEIAREKAGIIRPNGTLITLPQHPEANDVIGNTCMERGAHAESATQYVPNVSPGAVKFDHLRPTPQQVGAFLRTRYFLEVMGEEILVETPLIGRHQLRNVALAIAAAEQLNQCGFTISAANIADGIRDTQWPGRFQLVPGEAGQPDAVLDVAHNPAGAWALRSALSENFADRPLTLVFGAMRDKAVQEMAEILFPVADHVIVTQAHTPRAATAEEILAMVMRIAAETEAAPNVPRAIHRARELTPKNGLVVITGSIYIVGEALTTLQPA